MKSYKNTDKIIKDKYENFEPVFNAEQMWKQLEPQLQQDDKRRPFIWLLLFSGLLLVGLIGFFTFDSIKSTSLQSESKIQNAKTENDLNIEKNKLNQIVDNELKVSDRLKGNRAIEVDHKISSLKTEIKNDINQDLFSNESIEINKGASNFDSSIDDNQLNNSVESKIATNLNIVNTYSYKSNDVIDKSQNDWIEEGIDDTQNEINSVSGFILQKLNHCLISYVRPKLIVNHTPIITTAYNVSDESNSETDKNTYLNIACGYYTVTSNLTLNHQNAKNNFDKRLSEESPLDAWDASIIFSKEMNNHFSLFGGLRYSRIYTERKSVLQYVEEFSDDDFITEIIVSDSGTQNIRSSVTYDIMHNVSAHNYLRQSSLGLQLGLQYRLQRGRWTTSFDLASEVSIWNNRSGIITHNDRPYDIAVDSESLYSDNRHLLIMGGVGVGYDFSDYWGLFSQLRIIQPLSSEYNENYQITETKSQLGLNLGVRLKL